VIDALWRELLEDARWAPSPHNIQPWLLRVLSETEADLLYDPARLLPDTDPGGRFMTVGLAIFVEALAVAAAARGCSLTASHQPQPLDATAREPVLFARLRLVSPAAEEPLTRELLVERRTSRLPYDGRPVPVEVLDELMKVAGAFGHTLAFSSDTELVASVVRLNEDTLFYDLADPAARREVGIWLRFSEVAAARSRDGFSPAALGFPGPLLRLFFRGHRVLSLPGIEPAVHRLYRRTMRGTRTIGWLTGPFDEPSDWFQAGRLLLRLWLTMTRHGVRLHPFGSIVTNAQSNARLHDLIGAPDARATLWLVMRLGYSAVPPRAHRREIDELLVR
jgi:hypothetical protein